MVAFELFDAHGKPAATATRNIIARAAERGLLLLSWVAYGNVVRILVPLTAAPTLVDEGLDIIEACLAEAQEPTS